MQAEDGVKIEQTVSEANPPEVVVKTAEGVVSKRGRTLLAVLLAILIIILLLACGLLAKLMLPQGGDEGVDTKGITWIRSIYAYGPAPSQNIAPASVCAIPGGNSFWVADQDYFRLVEFNWNGSYKTVFDVDETGGSHNFPSAVAATRDGWLFVASSSYHTVKAYGPDRSLRWSTTVQQPHSITANDEMVVVGAQGGFVAFKRDGTPIGSVGRHGRGENDAEEFDTINGVQLDKDSNVYVVDTYNNRLNKYDKAGDLVWQVALGIEGNKGIDAQQGISSEENQKKYPAAMQMPMGCTIDAAGRIIIIDSLDFSIAAFSPQDGKFLGKWGTYGAADGQFAYPSDITYDSTRDWFAVTDTGNQRVEIIKLPGSGGNALAGLNAQLTGPLGMCAIFLLLLVLFTILSFIWNRLNKRRKEAELQRLNEQAKEESLQYAGGDKTAEPEERESS